MTWLAITSAIAVGVFIGMFGAGLILVLMAI
jgi:hypothetical protein